MFGEKDRYITVTTHDDDTYTCQLLELQDYHNKTYAALLKPDNTVLIYRYNRSNNTIDLDAISDQEFDKVKPLFTFYKESELSQSTYRKHDPKDCQQLLDRYNLSYLKKPLKNKLKTTIQLVYLSDKKHHHKDTTRVGGIPNVPPTFVWPKNNTPLDFLIQINCEDLPGDFEENLLPNKGMLYFFYDSDSCPTFSDGVVIYEEDITVLTPYKKYKPKYKPAYHTFIEICSLPDVESMTFSENINKEDYEAMTELMDGDTRMFGYPTWIQDDPFLDLKRYVDDPDFNKNDWVLLLQLDSIIEAKMNWIDWGCLYFFIKKDDLINTRFEGVKVILQYA